MSRVSAETREAAEAYWTAIAAKMLELFELAKGRPKSLSATGR